MKGHLFLIGFMGSGKSRWGLALAEHFQRPFVDLDQLITAGEKQSITEIFADRGENGFRELEQAYLHGMTAWPPSVVAVGGGTPCFFDNIEWINRHGLSIYLKVPLEVLIGRLERKDGQRPLLARHPREKWSEVLGEMLEHRRPFYEQAQQTLEYPGDDAIFFKQLCQAGSVLET